MILQEVLSTLGIADEEVKTYLALLEHGETTTGQLAKRMGTPRPSLYGFLKRLQEKGMVTQSFQYGVRVYSAESPEKINLLFEQKIENLQKSQTVYSELLEQLQQKGPSSFTQPKFQLFEGEAGIKHVLKDMLLYRNIETYSFWPIKTMIEALSPDFFRYLNKERIKNKLYTYAIWPDSQVIDTAEYPYLSSGEEMLREIRIAPSEVDFSMGYWIYANKAAFISSRKESVGFIIESAEMVEMLLAQHKVVWQISTLLEADTKAAKSFLQETKH